MCLPASTPWVEPTRHAFCVCQAIKRIEANREREIA
jgi:hypothetical protein